MKFCVVCENMYYLKIAEDETMQLTYYCPKCGNTEEQQKLECIKEVTYQKTEMTEQDINVYLKYDPTIPFSTTIKCPNIKCESNDPKMDKSLKKVIYYRYDEDNLKYMYMCCVCDSSWKP